jgi:WD40 repeat protein
MAPKENALATLRLLPAGTSPADLEGEVLCCAYTPDGAFVLVGGWDGCLRLWESAFGSHVTVIHASDKPISACAVGPDGKSLVSGSLEGMLAQWDAVTHQQKMIFLAHTRPLSAILFAPDGQLATASWDGTMILWKSVRQREAKTFSGHKDIVAGCRFLPDGQTLVSWSHDTTVRVWDVATTKERVQLTGHEDRVHAGGVSPDGRWAASGARDGGIRLWDLRAGREAAKATVGAEVRGCLFPLDGETLVIVDAAGQLTVHAVPSLEQQGELITDLLVTCAELSPTGGQIALGCHDGHVHLVALDGFDERPLCVTVVQTTRKTATPLQRLLGRSRLIYSYQCACPACRHVFEVPSGTAGQTASCANCKRRLKICGMIRGAREVS